jgi:hypothetical protein
MEWLYLRCGAVVHALDRTGVYGLDTSRAVCGLTALHWLNGDLYRRDWLGTGSQREYERAAALPKCERCVKILAV